MAAVRGRTITTFGSLFTPVGLSGGSPSAITHGARRVLKAQERGTHEALPRLTGGAGKRETHKADD
jgi:hypothetical protein